MTPEEVAELATKVRKYHSKGNHAVFLVDHKYVPDTVMTDLLPHFPTASVAGSCDAITQDGFWISVRPLIAHVPKSMMKVPGVSVCVIM